MANEAQRGSTRSDELGVIMLIGFAALFLVGLYLGYRMFVNVGGIRGYFALAGRTLWQIALVAATFVGYVVCFAVFHVIMSFLTGTRLRRTRIFISFKHDYEPIATEIEKGLADRDTEVIKLPFREQRDHDDVIGESLKAVTDADAVVAVPGAEPSWMANELGHAVGSQKPIVVIKHLAEQPLSDSLYRGYPVFAWEKLQVSGSAPLRRFLAFATRSRGDLWPQFRRCLADFGQWVGAGFVVFSLVGTVVQEVVRFLWAFAPSKAERVTMGYFWAVFALLAVAFAAGFAGALHRRIRGLAVARQKIRTREATFAEFSTVFSLLPADSKILDALEQVPLRPRHEGG